MKLQNLRIMMFVLIGVLFLSVSSAYAETIVLKPGNTVESFSDGVMNKIKNADFEKLFNDFYLPKDYKDNDIQNDKEGVTVGLRELLQNKLGLPENFARVNTVTETLITINIATGTIETIANLPSQDFFYKVIFSKFGAGYIAIGIYKDGEKFLVKNINIGLPDSDPKNIDIAQDFGRLMMGIAMEQQKRDLLSAPK